MAFYREKADWIANHSIGHLSSLKYLKKMMNRYVRHLSFEGTTIHKSSSKCYRGWATILILIATLVTSCEEQSLSFNLENNMSHQTALCTNVTENPRDSIQFYYDQARLGIGDAYVKMAHFYRDGTMGKPNLLKVIQMGFMAEEYVAIPNMETLFKNVPDSDVTKVTFMALDMLNHTDNEESLNNKADELLALKIPEGNIMKGMIAYKKGDTDNVIALFNKAIEDGSEIADVFKDIILSGIEYGDELQPQTLLKIADRFPLAYRLLGDHYAKSSNDSINNISLAAQYYRKASENACLGRREAQWMLSAIAQNRISAIDSIEIRRLYSLSRNEINDSVIFLP